MKRCDDGHAPFSPRSADRLVTEQLWLQCRIGTCRKGRHNDAVRREEIGRDQGEKIWRRHRRPGDGYVDGDIGAGPIFQTRVDDLRFRQREVPESLAQERRTAAARFEQYKI